MSGPDDHGAPIGGALAPPSHPSPPPRPWSHGPSPAVLIVVAMAVAAIVGVVVLATRDDGDSTTTTTTATTTEDVPDASNDRAFVDGLAAGLYESADGEISDEEASCIAEGLADAIGIDRLTELRRTAPGGDPIAALSDEEQRAMQSAMDRCVSGRSGTSG